MECCLSDKEHLQLGDRGGMGQRTGGDVSGTEGYWENKEQLAGENV